MINNTLPESSKNKKIRIAILLIAVIIIAIAISVWNYSKPVSRCSRAILLGNTYLENGQYEEAIAEFSSAVQIDPRQPEPYIRLGKTYLEYAGNIKVNSLTDNSSSSEQQKELMKKAADSYKQAEVAIGNLPDKAGIAQFSTPVLPMSMTLEELQSASEQIWVEIDDLENSDSVDQADIGSDQSNEPATEAASSAKLSLRAFPKENSDGTWAIATEDADGNRIIIDVPVPDGCKAVRTADEYRVLDMIDKINFEGNGVYHDTTFSIITGETLDELVQDDIDEYSQYENDLSFIEYYKTGPDQVQLDNNYNAVICTRRWTTSGTWGVAWGRIYIGIDNTVLVIQQQNRYYFDEGQGAGVVKSVDPDWLTGLGNSIIVEDTESN